VCCRPKGLIDGYVCPYSRFDSVNAEGKQRLQSTIVMFALGVVAFAVGEKRNTVQT
jgi:hypothetical protein